MRKTLALLFAVLIACSAFSIDFGANLDQEIDVYNDLFSYTASVVPWFSWSNGNNMSLYLSGIMSLEYKNDMDGESITSYRINQNMSVKAGRLNYKDILGFAAAGLFDGANFNLSLPIGDLKAGLYYTGLLYKETAKILMTEYDSAEYNDEWNWKKGGSYFASRRMLVTARWDMPFGNDIDFSAELLGQFDLNGKNDKLHSFYGGAKADYYPISVLRITGGALFELMNNGSKSGFAFGAFAQGKMELPGKLDDTAGITVKFTSAAPGNYFNCFTPLSSVTQGNVFPGTLAGLMLIGVDYNVKITKAIRAEAAARYFMRTYKVSGEGSAYGAEIWASGIWHIFDDLRAVIGAGAFFPGMGNIPNDEKVLWRINAGVSLAF